MDDARKPDHIDLVDAKRLIEADGKSVVLDETEMVTIQEILNAIGAIPHIWPQISAWMRAREFDDPDCNLEELRGRLF